MDTVVHHLLPLIVLASVALTHVQCQGQATLVSAPAGTFQGASTKDSSGNTYVAFKGIPYAQPPLGQLRFAKPQPLTKLNEVFDATQDGQRCPQPDVMLSAFGYEEQGDEDCLILNVYTQNTKPVSPKKVMVFIHGGGFVLGSSVEIDVGSFVTSQDVVFVTINYRLGILGFLSTQDGSCPGNFGLWDMTLALKWVKDNIASFGGDPEDVAISGESAGGSAVSYLSVSPHTKGLFTKAYPQSGTCTSTFGRALDPLKETVALASSLGCYESSSENPNSETTRKMINCLREKHFSNFTSQLPFSIDKVMFVPTVDGDFVPKSPLQLLKDDAYLQRVGFFERSYLVGIDNNEVALYKSHFAQMFGGVNSRDDITDDEKKAWVEKIVSSAYTFYISSRIDAPVSSAVMDKIVSWYSCRFGDNALAEMVSDLGFLLPTFDFVDAASRAKNSNVWLFYFNHYPKYMKGQVRGMPHGLDLTYYFDNGLEFIETILRMGIDTKIGMGQEDEILKSRMQSMIGELTKTGKLDSIAGSVGLGSVDWPRYNTKDKQYLDFKPRPEIRENLEVDKRRLWLEDVPQWIAADTTDHAHTEL